MATTTLAPTPPLAAPYAKRWWVLAVVLFAEVMDLVDSTVTNIAGPSVRADLGGSAATLQWLSAGYTLTFAVLLVSGARLGDIVGRRPLFLIGGAGFTFASALCAVATSPGLLIACRVLQGGFGALLIPQGFGMLKEVFPEEEMPKVFGLFGPVMGLSAVAGPILAGLLIDWDLLGTGWRLVFLINVPLGVAALVLGARVLPRSVAAAGTRLDVPGMLLVGAAAFALVYPLIQGREAGWPAWTFLLFAAGGVLLAAFVACERRRPQAPLVELSLLENRAFTSGLTLAVAFFAAVGGVLLVLSLFCQLGEGFSPARTGLALAPLSVGMVVAMVLSFVLVEKVGRKLINVGTLLAGLGLLLLAACVHGKAEVSAWTLTPGILVIGMGMGFVFGQLFDLILAGVADHEVGSASGILNAVQQLSFALGVAGLATAFFALLDHTRPSGDALADTALVALIPVGLAFLLAFRLPAKPRADH